MAPAEVARPNPAQGEVCSLTTRIGRRDRPRGWVGETVHGDGGEWPWSYPVEVVKDLRLRLRRAEGQVHAVKAMLSEGRAYRAIVMQLSAANKALEQVGFRLIASGRTYCVQHPRKPRSQAIRSTRSNGCSPSWDERRSPEQR
jgi:DNA-binding FrmR family transcriptional regulator